MKGSDKRIDLSHGAGGRASARLIRDLFLRYLKHPELLRLNDGAVLDWSAQGSLAISTDSFVVDPIEFPGGDIGKLAVCGTLNDLCMCASRPVALSLALILEEGLAFDLLERVIRSLAEESERAQVPVVTGDTKVVPHGRGDKIFVNTTGIGQSLTGRAVGAERAQPGDAILVSGPVGDHGTTIMAVRAGIELQGSLRSDCTNLMPLVLPWLESFPEVQCLRDPTRGGLAAVLNEIAEASQVSLEVVEGQVPVAANTRAACEILGLDPFHMACEGRFVAVVPAGSAEAALLVLHGLPGGAGARVIGSVKPIGRRPEVILKTSIGGARLLDLVEGEPLPRIC